MLLTSRIILTVFTLLTYLLFTTSFAVAVFLDGRIETSWKKLKKYYLMSIKSIKMILY